MKGSFDCCTNCPMETAIGESSKRYASVFCRRPPDKPKDLFDVRSPPPVSKEMGSEALVTKGEIAESGTPCSLSALFDRMVLPAPLSFKNSMTKELFDEAFARGLDTAATGRDAQNFPTKLGMAMRGTGGDSRIGLLTNVHANINRTRNRFIEPKRLGA